METGVGLVSLDLIVIGKIINAIYEIEVVREIIMVNQNVKEVISYHSISEVPGFVHMQMKILALQRKRKDKMKELITVIIFRIVISIDYTKHSSVNRIFKEDFSETIIVIFHMVINNLVVVMITMDLVVIIGKTLKQAEVKITNI